MSDNVMNSEPEPPLDSENAVGMDDPVEDQIRQAAFVIAAAYRRTSAPGLLRVKRLDLPIVQQIPAGLLFRPALFVFRFWWLLIFTAFFGWQSLLGWLIILYIVSLYKDREFLLDGIIRVPSDGLDVVQKFGLSAGEQIETTQFGRLVRPPDGVLDPVLDSKDVRDALAELSREQQQEAMRLVSQMLQADLFRTTKQIVDYSQRRGE